MTHQMFFSASFRCLIAAATLLAPMASNADGRVSADDTRWLQTPQTVAVAQLDIASIVETPYAKLWPTEVLTAAGLQYVGFDPLAIDRVEVSIEPPLGPQLYYAIRLDMSEAFSWGDLSPEVMSKLTQVEGSAGRVAYAVEPGDPNAPVLTLLDDDTLVAASPGMMKKLFRESRKPATGEFFEWIDSRSTASDAHLGVNFGPLRPLANMAISFGMKQAAAELEAPLYDLVDRLAQAPNEIEYIEAWADLTQKGQAGIAIQAPDEASADRLAESLEALRELNIVQLEMAAAELDRTDPTQSAMADYLYRIGPLYADSTQPIREGVRFKRVVPPENKNDQFTLVMAQTAVIGLLVALLLPAVQAAREAARRNVSLNHAKQIVLALLVYEDARGDFPPQAIADSEGKPLLSWRVAILPYLGETDLYNAFALDEPWDSPTNRPLIARMPEIYSDPSGQFGAETGRTHYLGLVGEQAFFASSNEPRSLRDITDGTSRSIAFVQVNDANSVEWTRPADYDVEAHKHDPVGGIGSLHPGIFLAAYADGAVRSISLEIDHDTLRALFTIDGGERIELP